MVVLINFKMYIFFYLMIFFSKIYYIEMKVLIYLKIFIFDCLLYYFLVVGAGFEKLNLDKWENNWIKNSILILLNIVYLLKIMYFNLKVYVIF